jgi:hypothetical protein
MNNILKYIIGGYKKYELSFGLCYINGTIDKILIQCNKKPFVYIALHINENRGNELCKFEMDGINEEQKNKNQILYNLFENNQMNININIPFEEVLMSFVEKTLKNMDVKWRMAIPIIKQHITKNLNKNK